MAEMRKQFTMYESIYKSLQRIRNAKDRANAYDAICAYALYNQEPDLSKVSDAVAIAFELTRPVLDSARKKAENGKQGGSKPKAKGKQSAREKEGEIENEEEKEVEIEKENEIEKESYSFCGDGGDHARARAATEEEVLSIGLEPGEAIGITVNQVNFTRCTAKALFDKYMPKACSPQPWDMRQVFLNCGTTERAELLDYAFEKAAVAGRPGSWPYISGIMERLSMRGIETKQQAREWDAERPDLEFNE